METEGSCPFPILWPPTQIDGGLNYEIPLTAPCLRNQFKWTIQDPTGFHKELCTILEPKSKTEVEMSDLIPDHVSDVRQAGAQMLQWTRSPCADRYVVHVNGQQLTTTENWVHLNTSDICEEVLVEVVAHLGERSSLPASALFNTCAKERGPDGELTSWMRRSLMITQKENTKPICP